MPTATPTEDRQTIAMPADGDGLKAIRAYAAEEDLPLGRAAFALLNKGLTASAFLAELDDEEEAEAKTPRIIDLAAVPAEWLSDEIERRLNAAATADAFVAAANQRAEEAERRVARVQAVLAGAE